MRSFLTVPLLTLALAALAFPADAVKPLTPTALDALIQQELKQSPAGRASDEQFLRRVSLDLIGRPPSIAELKTFLDDASADRRGQVIDRLLANPEFGQNWANYWSDTISYHVPPPELTFLSYKPFKDWLAARFNANDSWATVTKEILTANGTVKTNPAATFIGYHRGNATKLAAETARVFLGLQLHCAQCHNHKFDRWKRSRVSRLRRLLRPRRRQAGGPRWLGHGRQGQGEGRAPDAGRPRSSQEGHGDAAGRARW